LIECLQLRARGDRRPSDSPMLVAVAGTDPGQRTFRVDRIVEAESTDDLPTAPTAAPLRPCGRRSSARSSSAFHDVGDRAHRGAIRADPAGPLRAPLPRRRRARRWPGLGPRRRTHINWTSPAASPAGV
jgi:hypothetical protein